MSKRCCHHPWSLVTKSELNHPGSLVTESERNHPGSLVTESELNHPGSLVIESELNHPRYGLSIHSQSSYSFTCNVLVVFWKTDRIIERVHQGVQPRMVLVVHFFVFFNYFFFLSCCYMWPSAQCGDYISFSLPASSSWKSFLKYAICSFTGIIHILYRCISSSCIYISSRYLDLLCYKVFVVYHLILFTIYRCI